jgi:4-alpha-glucanotransferase
MTVDRNPNFEIRSSKRARNRKSGAKESRSHRAQTSHLDRTANRAAGASSQAIREERRNVSVFVADAGRDVPRSVSVARLAQAAGIETAYTDYSGNVRQVPEQSLRAILRLMGREADCEKLGHVQASETQNGQDGQMPSVLIAWNGRLRARALQELERQSSAYRKVRLRLEDGQEVKDLLRAGELPLGYHHVIIETESGPSETLLISAPRRSYSNTSSAERSGIFAPLYALRSASNWGAGNFSDLVTLGKGLTRAGAPLCNAARSTGSPAGQVGNGCGFIATLPLNAGFLDGAMKDASPYSPVSRLFWNEFYIDIERLPEFATCKKAQTKFHSRDSQKRLACLRGAGWVEYTDGIRLRRSVLELLARAANTDELERFMRERPLVREYARFRAVCDRMDRPWQEWPERMRRGGIQLGDFAQSDERYYVYNAVGGTTADS